LSESIKSPKNYPSIAYAEGVTIVGGGSLTERELSQAMQFAPRLIGADSGGQLIGAFNKVPEYVIGDFDSTSEEFLDTFPSDRQIKIWDQDRTDLNKCLSVVNAPYYIGVGVLGDRIDHALGAFNNLLQFAHKHILLLNEVHVCFLVPPKLCLQLPLDTTISLFPFGAITGKSSGLKWEIDSIAFAPCGMTGISNMTIKKKVELQFNQPKMICILAKEYLETVLESLQGALQWPQVEP